MKIPAFVLLVSLSLPATSALAGDLQKQSAIRYFEALVTGNVARADSLATVPYSLEGEVLRSMDEVKALHRKILEDKGRRKAPRFSVRQTSGSPLDSTVFAPHRTFQFFTGKKTLVNVYVTTGDSAKVVGFVD